MPESTLIILGIFVVSLVIINLLAAAFGVDSRPTDPVTWI